MSSNTKVGPNDLCPCGSGEKFKRCCESKEVAPSRMGRRIVIGLVVVFGVSTLALASLERKSREAAPATGYIPRAMPNARPSGPAPPGKVWSTEHGHWHNTTTAGQTGTGSSSAVQYTPQPDGPVPAGKVWSAEHGHWHNAQ